MCDKHIVIMTNNFANGGTERRAMVLANEFYKKGCKVTFLVTKKIYQDVLYDLNKDIDILNVEDLENAEPITRKKAEKWIRKKQKSLNLLHKISKKLKCQDIYIKRKKNLLGELSTLRAFIISNSDAIYIAFGIQVYEKLAYASEGINCKRIFTDVSATQFMQSIEEEILYKKVFFKLAREADFCVFQTEQQKSYYGKHVKNNGVVIRNPLSSDLPYKYEGERQKKIVNFCRTHPAKNLMLLINAFVKFSEFYPEYELIIYGATSTKMAEDYKQELLTYVEKIGMSEKIKILNAIPNVHQKIYDYSMFVSSSVLEGLSNSMIEALAIGLPCVCTDCLGGGAREMIVDGENGLLIPNNDVEAMSKAMCRMIDEKGLAERCSNNAYKIREELAVENIVDKWLQLFEI